MISMPVVSKFNATPPMIPRETIHLRGQPLLIITSPKRIHVDEGENDREEALGK
jgi:hypothetical protein